MSRLSIIVPFVGENQPFEDTLVSVLQNRPGNCEVLVVHRGRYGDPYELNGEVRFVAVAAEAALLEALNAGLAAATGDLVHILQPDVLVTDGWADAARARFDDPSVAAVAPLMLDVADGERIVAAGLGYTLGGRRLVNGLGEPRSRLEWVAARPVVAPLLTAAFYRRAAVAAVGGLAVEVGPLNADLDLGLALRMLGFRCVLESGAVIRGHAPVPATASFEAGRGAERVFWRYWRESGSFVPLLAHTGHVVGSVLSSAHRPQAYAQLAGRLAASVEWSCYNQHRKRLRRAAETCPLSGQTSAAADEEDELPDTLGLRRCRGQAA